MRRRNGRVEYQNMLSVEKYGEGRMEKRIEFRVDEDTLGECLVYRMLRGQTEEKYRVKIWSRKAYIRGISSAQKESKSRMSKYIEY